MFIYCTLCIKIAEYVYIYILFICMLALDICSASPKLGIKGRSGESQRRGGGSPCWEVGGASNKKVITVVVDVRFNLGSEWCSRHAQFILERRETRVEAWPFQKYPCFLTTRLRSCSMLHLRFDNMGFFVDGRQGMIWLGYNWMCAVWRVLEDHG